MTSPPNRVEPILDICNSVVGFDISSNFTSDVSGTIVLQQDRDNSSPPVYIDISTNKTTTNETRFIIPVTGATQNPLPAGRYQIVFSSHAQDTSFNNILGTLTFHQPSYQQSMLVSVLTPTTITLSYPNPLPPFHTTLEGIVVNWFLGDFNSPALATTHTNETTNSYNLLVLGITDSRVYYGRVKYTDTSNNLFFGTDIIDASSNAIIDSTSHPININTNLKWRTINQIDSTNINIHEIVALETKFLAVGRDEITSFDVSGNFTQI